MGGGVGRELGMLLTYDHAGSRCLTATRSPPSCTVDSAVATACRTVYLCFRLGINCLIREVQIT